LRGERPHRKEYTNRSQEIKRTTRHRLQRRSNDRNYWLKSMARRSFYLLCTICVLLSVRPLAAQTRTAMLEGTVRDASGAVMPGATVTVVDANTNQARTLSTNSQGFFRAPELPVGTYDVCVDFPGF